MKFIENKLGMEGVYAYAYGQAAEVSRSERVSDSELVFVVVSSDVLVLYNGHRAGDDLHTKLA